MILYSDFQKDFEEHSDDLLKTILILFLAGFPVVSLSILLVLILSSCGSTKHIPVETIHEVTKTDTLYINNVQYDSIYIDRFAQVQKVQGVQEVQGVRVDTLIKELTKYEYKYKLLRDTIYRTKIDVQRDSIPYEVRVVETKEVKYIPPWIKTLAWIGGITILLIVLFFVLKLTNR